jgi:hypothetical protein
LDTMAMRTGRRTSTHARLRRLSSPITA